MTDTTTTDEPESSTDVEEAAAAAIEAPADAEPVKFWDRPYVERYLTPLVLPLAAIGGVILFVINVSRIFLAGHGDIPVIAGTTITLLILLGAASLSAAPRLRNSSVVMLTAGFIVALTFAGWISLGTAEPEGEVSGPLPTDLAVPEERIIDVVAGPGGQLIFEPDAFPIPTGLVKFRVDFQSGGHTFGFHDPSVRAVEVEGTGVQETVGFFAGPGDYVFFCATSGHEAAGMHGTATAEGAPTTLEEALVEAGLPPDAAGGGEGGGH
jgi:hypothetical protein